MNIVFAIALLAYLVVFIVIGILDIKNIKSFTDYSVAGKKQSSLAVVMTLLATVVGASTTIGITTTVYNIGFYPGKSGRSERTPCPIWPAELPDVRRKSSYL